MTAVIGQTTTGPDAIANATVIAMTTTAGPTGITADRVEITGGRIGTRVGPIAPAITVGPIVAAGAAIATTTHAT
jgi:hypothetical protein